MAITACFPQGLQRWNLLRNQQPPLARQLLGPIGPASQRGITCPRERAGAERRSATPKGFDPCGAKPAAVGGIAKEKREMGDLGAAWRPRKQAHQSRPTGDVDKPEIAATAHSIRSSKPASMVLKIDGKISPPDLRLATDTASRSKNYPHMEAQNRG